MSEGHGAAEPAPMVIEATPFAKSSSNGDNGSGGQSSDWRILKMSSLSHSFFHVLSCPRGGEVCRNDYVTTCSLF